MFEHIIIRHTILLSLICAFKLISREQIQQLFTYYWHNITTRFDAICRNKVIIYFNILPHHISMCKSDCGAREDVFIKTELMLLCIAVTFLTPDKYLFAGTYQIVYFFCTGSYGLTSITFL